MSTLPARFRGALSDILMKGGLDEDGVKQARHRQTRTRRCRDASLEPCFFLCAQAFDGDRLATDRREDKPNKVRVRVRLCICMLHVACRNREAHFFSPPGLRQVALLSMSGSGKSTIIMYMAFIGYLDLVRPEGVLARDLLEALREAR